MNVLRVGGRPSGRASCVQPRKAFIMITSGGPWAGQAACSRAGYSLGLARSSSRIM